MCSIPMSRYSRIIDTTNFVLDTPTKRANEFMYASVGQIKFDLLFIAEHRTVSTGEANQVFFLPLNDVIRSDFLPASVAYTLQRDLLFYRPCRKR